MKYLRLIIVAFLTCFIGCESKPPTKRQTVQEKKADPVFQESFFGSSFRTREEVNNIYKKMNDGYDMDTPLVARFVKHLNSDNIPDTVFFEKINNWNDPGDIHNVRVSVSGQEELVVFNGSGWIKLIGSTQQKLRKIESENLSVNNELVTAEIAKGEKLIFLFGYIYASEPGVLTVISLKEGYDPKFVFNEQCQLVDVIDLNGDGRKEVIVATDYEKTKFKVYEVNLWFKENAALIDKL